MDSPTKASSEDKPLNQEEAIALLRQIFPNDSIENLIKLHEERLRHATKRQINQVVATELEYNSSYNKKAKSTSK